MVALFILFILFDEVGPGEFHGRAEHRRAAAPAHRPATTHLFRGEILHRDSLGSAQAIRPGEVNWMAARRGIAHRGANLEIVLCDTLNMRRCPRPP